MRRKLIFAGIAVFAIALWMPWHNRNSPANHVLWSVAVARFPGSTGYIPSTQIYLASADAVYVPSGFVAWSRKQIPKRGPIVALAADAKGFIAAGTTDGSVFTSHDEGEHWSSFNVSQFPVTSLVLSEDSSVLFVTTFGDGILQLRNGEVRKISIGPGPAVWCMTQLDNAHQFAAFTTTGLFISNNDGESWRRVGTNSNVSQCGYDGETTTFALVDGVLFVSRGAGQRSTHLYFKGGPEFGAWAIAADRAGDVVVGTSLGIMWSQDSGTTWNDLDLNSNPLPIDRLVRSAHAAGGGHTIDPHIDPATGPIIIPQLSTALVDTHVSSTPYLSPPSQPSINSWNQNRKTPELDDDAPPPPPPPRPRAVPQVVAPCVVDASGDGQKCPKSFEEVEAYLQDLGRAQSLTTVANGLINGHDLLGVAQTYAQEQAIQQSLQALVKRMVDNVVLPIQAWAQSTNRAAAMAAVRDHEEYVSHIKEEAIEQSRGHSSDTGTNHDQSARHAPSGGEAMHQLVYSSVHGAGWWH